MVTSCQQKKVTPSGVIPKDQMQSILTDIHYAQVKVAMESLPADSANTHLVSYYQHVFRLHHITAQQFLDSFDYYTQHPDQMDDVYQNMINDLNKNINTNQTKMTNTK